MDSRAHAGLGDATRARVARLAVRAISWTLVLLLAVPGCGTDAPDEDDAVMVAAASSLRHVLPKLAAAFEARFPGAPVRATYAASGTLRRQVQAGAPMDAVLFAGPRHVDTLAAAGLVEATSRRVVATNVLVLVGHDRSPALTFRTLDRDEASSVAISDPASAPAGRYGKEALEALGLWSRVEKRLVFAANVAAVLTYVRRREVAAGIAYATETVGVDGVRVLDRAEGAWAPRPTVVGGVAASARHPERAKAFLAFLESETARAVWQEAGFGRP